jgi:RNA polymerase sigma-70 factor (ECF subfamily)
VDGLGTDEICAALGITPNNAWVMLHRARLALRRCLETVWFGRTEDEGEGTPPTRL